mmetsp:Transcript_1066/g.2494  ORF Transcript_1066/g.2494 Transcript_1066/m.2494 type:complete len:217 (-) Transcript_1066:1065-1715(-)
MGDWESSQRVVRGLLASRRPTAAAGLLGDGIGGACNARKRRYGTSARGWSSTCSAAATWGVMADTSTAAAGSSGSASSQSPASPRSGVSFSGSAASQTLPPPLASLPLTAAVEVDCPADACGPEGADSMGSPSPSVAEAVAAGLSCRSTSARHSCELARMLAEWLARPAARHSRLEAASFACAESGCACRMPRRMLWIARILSSGGGGASEASEGS